MNNGFNPDNAGRTDTADSGFNSIKSNSIYRISKADRSKIINNRAHLTEISSEYHAWDNIKRGRGVENLSFQEWTEKYHQ